MAMLPMSLGDPYIPQTTSISIVCVTFHIFIVDFKFGLQVDHSMSQPTDDKSFLKGIWSRHMTNFKFLVPLKYIWNAQS